MQGVKPFKPNQNLYVLVIVAVLIIMIISQNLSIWIVGVIFILVITKQLSRPKIINGKVVCSSPAPNPLDLFNGSIQVKSIQRVEFVFVRGPGNSFATQKAILLHGTNGQKLKINSTNYDQEFLRNLRNANPLIVFDDASQEVVDRGTYNLADKAHAQADLKVGKNQLIYIGVFLLINFLLWLFKQYG